MCRKCSRVLRMTSQLRLDAWSMIFLYHPSVTRHAQKKSLITFEYRQSSRHFHTTYNLCILSLSPEIGCKNNLIPDIQMELFTNPDNIIIISLNTINHSLFSCQPIFRTLVQSRAKAMKTPENLSSFLKVFSFLKVKWKVSTSKSSQPEKSFVHKIVPIFHCYVYIVLVRIKF